MIFAAACIPNMRTDYDSTLYTTELRLNPLSDVHCILIIEIEFYFGENKSNSWGEKPLLLHC